MSNVVVALALASVAIAWSTRRPQAQAAMVAVTFSAGPAWHADKTPNDQNGFREHSANLARLRREERIIMGGRFGAFGLILVRAESEALAREFFRDDPTLSSGVFKAEFNAWRTIYSGTVPN